MLKLFKEFISYVGGHRLNVGGLKPIASLGDSPPKTYIGRTSGALSASKKTIPGLEFTDGQTARKSVSKIKNSDKTISHKLLAATIMSQRAKVASQRAKDPEKKKNLGQAHEVYQRYVEQNKKEN